MKEAIVETNLKSSKYTVWLLVSVIVASGANKTFAVPAWSELVNKLVNKRNPEEKRSLLHTPSRPTTSNTKKPLRKLPHPSELGRLKNSFIWRAPYGTDALDQELLQIIKNQDPYDREVRFNRIQSLLQQGANPNTLDPDNFGLPSLLHKATRMPEEIVYLLLQFGANPNPKNTLGVTPLHELCYSSKNVDEQLQLLIANILLKNGANLEAGVQTNLGTPLHIACFVGSPKKVQYLLERGADVDALKEDGTPPLYRALHSDSDPKGKIDLLIEYGADKELLKKYIALT